MNDPSRHRARALAAEALADGDALGWFERLYREAAAGDAIVPWADLAPNPQLVAWFTGQEPRWLRALVVGCGYGDDAEYLAAVGIPASWPSTLPRPPSHARVNGSRAPRSATSSPTPSTRHRLGAACSTSSSRSTPSRCCRPSCEHHLARAGFVIGPGAMGENITTAGVDLLGLPRGTVLRIGGDAMIEITGLRNPCAQLDELADGLMAATLDRAPDGSLVRKAGVMGIVLVSGSVRAGDAVRVLLPSPPYRPLERV